MRQVFLISMLIINLLTLFTSCNDDVSQSFEVFYNGDSYLTSKAGKINIYVRSNYEYAINIQSDSSWLSVSEISSERYDILTFAYEQNRSTTERDAKIVITCNDGNHRSLKFRQSGLEDVIFGENNMLYSVSSEGDTLEFFVNSDIEFEYNIDSEEEWIISDNSRKKFNSVSFICLENLSAEYRKSVIYFNTTDLSQKDTVIITQKPKPVSAKMINSFCLKQKDNPDQLINDIYCEIDNDNNYIKAFIPYRTDNLSFTPHVIYEGCSLYALTRDGKRINVNNEGIFGQNIDFSTYPTFIVEDYLGEKKEYEVFITWYNNIPVLSLTTEGRKAITSKKDYLNGFFRLEGCSYIPESEGSMRIRGRGNSTWQLPKKPYRLKLDAKQEVGGMPADKDWALLANYTDRTSLRNALAFKISSLTDLEYTPRMQFCDLYTNGEYSGIYAITEHLKVSPDRINVGKTGYVIEITPSDRIESDELYFSTKRLNFTFKDTDVDPGSERYEWISRHINQIENVIYSSGFADPDSGYAKYIDAESFADWYIVNELSKNNDARFFSSCFMHIIPGGKLKMGPVWDFDIAFGNCNYNGCESFEGFWVKRSVWLERLFEDPVFAALVKERFRKMKTNKNYLSSYIKMQSLIIDKAREEDNRKWNYLGVSVWPNYVVFDSFEKEVQYLQDWLNNRFEWLDKALSDL